MSFLEIQSLRQDVARSDPRNPQEQAVLLERIQYLRQLLEGAAADDLLGYLDAAAMMTGYLTDMAGIGPEEILQMTQRLLTSVETAFDGTGGVQRDPEEVPAGIAPAPRVETTQRAETTETTANTENTAQTTPAPAVPCAATETEGANGELRIAGMPDLPPAPMAGNAPGLGANYGGSRGLRLAHELFLGEVLIQLGFCNADQIADGLRIQRATGLRIGEALVQIGAASWDQVQRAVRVQGNLRLGPAGEVSTDSISLR